MNLRRKDEGVKIVWFVMCVGSDNRVPLCLTQRLFYFIGNILLWPRCHK